MTPTEMRHVLASVKYGEWDFLVRTERQGGRSFLQVQASGTCNVSGCEHTWRGRKWFLSPHMTKSELVQTAFKAVLTAVEHEARENFLYRGASIFDPHYDVDRLHDLRSRPYSLDERES